MNKFQLIRTMPEQGDYDLFHSLPKKLYNDDSPRFVLGNDPVNENLEGCYVLSDKGITVGRFALYNNSQLKHENEPVGCIGSYECVDDIEISSELLQCACDLAIKQNMKWLIGPMEGSTWNNYRFSAHNRQPNFFMEPYHHEYYNEQFVNFGMQPLAHYISNLDTQLDYDSEKLSKLEERYAERGAVMRNLNMKNLEADLYKIALFSIRAFANNFLYTSINEEQFVRKYLKLRDLYNPDLVWIVEDSKGEMQALSFSIKDYNDPTGKTIIIKSLARLENSTFRGIGGYLASKTNQIARQQGFNRAIHALMIDDNASVLISNKHSGEAYKSYTLFGRSL